jgi:lipoate-protein ligase A
MPAAGVDVVRRPTGGRAILHTDELTYSVIAPDTEPRVAGTIVESYKRLSEGLLNGLLLMGVPTRQVEQPDDHDRDQGPVCFEVPSNYEIVFDGKKLVGSAQMRKAGVVLQHGTIPLHGDIARISLYLAQHPDPNRVRNRATTVEAAIGRVVDYDTAARLWPRAADAHFNLKQANLPRKNGRGQKSLGESTRRTSGRIVFDECRVKSEA